MNPTEKESDLVGVLLLLPLLLPLAPSSSDTQQLSLSLVAMLSAAAAAAAVSAAEKPNPPQPSSSAVLSSSPKKAAHRADRGLIPLIMGEASMVAPLLLLRLTMFETFSGLVRPTVVTLVARSPPRGYGYYHRKLGQVHRVQAGGWVALSRQKPLGFYQWGLRECFWMEHSPVRPGTV